MGYETDCLKIIKLTWKGMKNLRILIEKEKPDLMFLPGGNPELDILARSSYRYLVDPTFKEPILLYDSTRIKVTLLQKPQQLASPSCNFDNVLTPLVDIYSPAPAQNIVKQFVCVNWHWKLTETGGSKDLYENGRSYLMYSQNLAYLTGKEVLIGGDLNLSLSEMKKLIKEHNQMVQQGIDSLKPEFQKFGYMDCMTETITRPEKRLRQLQLHKNNNTTDANPIIASKEMQLFETRHVTGENLNYNSTGLQFQPRVETKYRAKSTHNETGTGSNYHLDQCLRKTKSNIDTTFSNANVNTNQCPNPTFSNANVNTNHCPNPTFSNANVTTDYFPNPTFYNANCTTNIYPNSTFSTNVTTNYFPNSTFSNANCTTDYTATQMYIPPRPPKHHGG